MTTTIYRNDTTGYTVTLTDNDHGAARVRTSDGFDFPMVGSDYPYAGLLASSRAHLNGATEVPAPVAAQMASPLAPVAQVTSARPLATGATLTMPTLPQARCLAWAQNRSLDHRVRRGPASVTGMTAPLTVLVAMDRRGWLDLDHPAMPWYGTLTDTGRRALATYVAKHGEVL